MLVLLAWVTAAQAVQGQYPGQVAKKETSANPRAVAVLEYVGEPLKPKQSRLIPVSYFYAGEFQDAGIYLAQPAPVALTPGTEYELQRAGMPLGLYDLESAGRIGASFIGFGTAKGLPVEKPRGKQTVVLDEERPRMKKSSNSAGDEKKRQADAPGHPADTGGDGKRQTDETATPTDSSPLSGDRPTLRRKATGGKQQAVAEPAPVPDISDPDRPKMQHAQPKQAGEGTVHLVGNPPDVAQVVAVSDAGTKEPHPFAYNWGSAAEQAQAQQKLTAMVEKLLAGAGGAGGEKSAAHGTAARARNSRNAARAASPTAAASAGRAAAGPTLTDVSVASFALTYENTPTLVMSARTAEASARSITVIAEFDLYNEPRVLFSSIKDAAHPDTPEMHLVDAVDAQGNNRASLLFELRGASDRQFALYRVARGTVEQQFVTDPVPYSATVAAE